MVYSTSRLHAIGSATVTSRHLKTPPDKYLVIRTMDRGDPEEGRKVVPPPQWNHGCKRRCTGDLNYCISFSSNRDDIAPRSLRESPDRSFCSCSCSLKTYPSNGDRENEAFHTMHINNANSSEKRRLPGSIPTDVCHEIMDSCQIRTCAPPSGCGHQVINAASSTASSSGEKISSSVQDDINTRGRSGSLGESSISSKKRRIGEDDQNNGGEPGGNDKNPRKDRQNILDGHSKKLACPYYKRNPRKQPKSASCFYPGFSTVARLKEHLYRNHTRPIQCPRCYKRFDDKALVNEHLRAQERCPEMPADQALEGFDTEQAMMLRSKKRTRGDDTEERKWKSVFRILFPEVQEDDIPSPWLEHDIDPQSMDLSQNPQILTEYERYSKEHIPAVIRKKLGCHEQDIHDLEERIQARLQEFFQTCQQELMSSFRGTGSLAGQSQDSIIHGSTESLPTPREESEAGY